MLTLYVHHPPFLLARIIARPIIIAAKNKTGHKTKYSGNRCHHLVDSLATLLLSSSSVNGIVLLITSIKSRSRASSTVGGGGGGIEPISIQGVSSQVSTTTAFADGIASISRLSVGTVDTGTTVSVCTATVVTPRGTEEICRLCICCRHDMLFINQIPSPIMIRFCPHLIYRSSSSLFPSNTTWRDRLWGGESHEPVVRTKETGVVTFKILS